MFVLITSTGDRLYFYIKECAETYKSIHGGEVYKVDVDTGKIIWDSNVVKVKFG